MKKKYFYVYTIVFVFIIIFLTYLCIHDYRHDSRQYYPASDVCEWTDYSITSRSDDSCQITGTLDTSQSPGYMFAFYSVHQELEIYEDSELIYQYPVINDNPFSQSPGYNWNFVPLPQDELDLTIKISSPYQGYASSIPTFLLGTPMAVFTKIVCSSIVSFLLCIIIFCVGICMITYWIFVRHKVKIQKNLLQLGIFALFLAAWSINESSLTTLLFRNNIICSYVSFLSLMMMPFAFAVFVRSFYENESKAWDMYCIGNVIQIILCLVLQLLHIADLRETLWTTHAMMGILAILVFTCSIKQLLQGVHSKRVMLHLFCLMICTVTLVMDLIAFYHGSWDSNGFGRLGFLCYILLLGIASAKESASLMKMGKMANTYQQLAYTDQMTGLLNRAAFNRDFDKYSSSPTDIAVIDFDLNNLKKTNDTFGHIAGDRYITDAAHLIEEIFTGIGKCYRIGGDEFAVLLENACNVDIPHYLSMLEWSVDSYNRDKNEEFNMQIAYGSAIYSASTDITLEATFSRADKSMYSNKKLKKGTP